jgi:hypothetical protein
MFGPECLRGWPILQKGFRDHFLADIKESARMVLFGVRQLTPLRKEKFTGVDFLLPMNRTDRESCLRVAFFFYGFATSQNLDRSMYDGFKKDHFKRNLPMEKTF